LTGEIPQIEPATPREKLQEEIFNENRSSARGGFGHLLKFSVSTTGWRQR
jgi:hypothetical protein